MVEIADLQAIALFQGLTPAELEEIRPFVSEKPYKAGMALFREGNPGGILYLVKHGEIEIYKRHLDRDLRLAMLKRGSFMGEMSLIDDEPRSASARAITDSILMILTRKSFQQMLTADPAVGNKMLMTLLKILSQRLRENNRKLTTNA